MGGWVGGEKELWGLLSAGTTFTVTKTWERGLTLQFYPGFVSLSDYFMGYLVFLCDTVASYDSEVGHTFI